MKEPVINVGIMDATEICFHADGSCRTVTACDGRVVCDGVSVAELRVEPTDGVLELEDVTIGVNFHWERKENQKFTGALRFVTDERDGSRVIAINEVGVEDYLKSVISSEMSAGCSEALLRAHAVVSRSWLLRQIADRGKHTAAELGGWKKTQVEGRETDELVRWYDREDHTQFDVCADDHCQRYQGITRQTSPVVAEAVDATRGCVLMWDGAICDARFSKCCGGASELFENCWEETPHPYLESVADRAGGETADFCDTADDAILSQVLNSYDRETKDFYRWQVRYSPRELSDLIARRSGIDFGMITALTPLKRGASGRIVRLLVEGEKRSAVVGKELEIRRWLSESHLRSSAFEVERDGEDFVLTGRGWGHGVGLCQIGAAVMGAKGYDYKAILNHYFPKAELKKIY